MSFNKEQEAEKVILGLSPSVTEKLGFYVYILIDPRNGKIFYVGKGQGDRVLQHVKGALKDATESEKIATIRQILSDGKDVKYYIVRHGLDEKCAYEIESMLIDFLTYPDFKDVAKLTNIVSGHHQWEYGIKTISEIKEMYDSQPCDFSDIKEKFIAININKSFDKSKADSVYEGVRRAWIVSTRHAKGRVVLAVYQGIVRGIFKTDDKGWQEDPDEAGRMCFNKTDDVDLSFLEQKLLNKRLPEEYKFNQNPIRYIG